MYFATDGSYGDATDMLIVDTDTLTQEDLDDIVNASDNGRLQLVQSMVYCMGLPDNHTICTRCNTCLTCGAREPTPYNWQGRISK